MRVLGFDTATALTAVALRDFEDEANLCLRTLVDSSAVDEPPAGGRPGHAQRLLLLIHQLIEQSGAGWEAVDRIAVGVGPGELVLIATGSSARQTVATQNRPCDAVIMAIVDSWEIGGVDKYKKN